MVKRVAICLTVAIMSACNQPIDTAAESRKLVETDWAFARASAEQGAAAAFNEFLAEEATMFPMGAHPIVGRSEIHAVMSAGPSGVLTWEPQKGEVARAGDMGWTWGKYRSERTGENGELIVRHGKYVNVWKKQANGEWRVIVDIGNPSPAPEDTLKN